MSLFDQLQADWKQAFKNREGVKKDILSYVLAQLKNKRIDLGRELEDNEVLKLLQKEVKLREESINLMEKAGQDEEVSLEKQRIVILQEYLPTLLSEVELKDIVEKMMAQLDITDLGKQRGQLIGAIMKEYGAQVDGGRLNQVISSLNR